MKKYFKLSSLFLYLISFVSFFFVGASVAGVLGLAEGQGLAGGAIILGYGLLGSVTAVVIAIFMVNLCSSKVIVWTNVALTCVTAILVIYFTLNYQNRERERESNQEPKQQSTTAPANSISLEIPLDATAADQGLGMFEPTIADNSVLYFYGNPNFDKALIEHPPLDSLKFELQEGGQFEIVFAPPWLMPEHLKLDYDVIYFKVISITDQFVEVVVNTQTGQTLFVDKYAGDVLLWPVFLLNMHTIEFLDSADQRVLVKPLDHASEVSISFEFMKPIRISDRWAEVDLLNNEFTSVGRGWIKWMDAGSIQVAYSLFS